MSNTDRRIQKTRNAIYQALNSLMEENKFRNITVQEIIDRANVGRSTFYEHFETKDELLNSMVDDIFESFNEHLEGHIGEYHQRMIPVEELLLHIQENKKRIMGLFADDNDDLISNRFKSFWDEKLHSYFNQNIPQVNYIIPLDFLINHITGSLVEMIKWWVNGGMKYSPKEMNGYWEKLMEYIIKGMHE